MALTLPFLDPHQRRGGEEVRRERGSLGSLWLRFKSRSCSWLPVHCWDLLVLTSVAWSLSPSAFPEPLPRILTLLFGLWKADSFLPPFVCGCCFLPPPRNVPQPESPGPLSHLSCPLWLAFCLAVFTSSQSPGCGSWPLRLKSPLSKIKALLGPAVVPGPGMLSPALTHSGLDCAVLFFWFLPVFA